MAQPHKGPRRQVKARIPEPLANLIAAYAADHDLTFSESIGDLAALALDYPLPSETLPQPKTRRQREELPLSMSA